MKSDDFYVGWMKDAPASFTNFIRKYLLALSLVVITIGILLATQQKKFSRGEFEFGKATTVKGIYYSIPVPHVEVDAEGSTVFIPLVGYGKQGAEGIMQDLSNERHISFEGRELCLNGSLIHSDGKILMQIDHRDEPIRSLGGLSSQKRSPEKNLGAVVLHGEIIDPKCYFGVMKPGEGKVHKDCAIRCISGGIPPVLAITNEKGEKRYVLLTSANGEKLNDKVLDFVAVPSEVTGELKQMGDWLVMAVANIQSTSKSERDKKISGIRACCGETRQ